MITVTAIFIKWSAIMAMMVIIIMLPAIDTIILSGGPLKPVEAPSESRGKQTHR